MECETCKRLERLVNRREKALEKILELATRKIRYHDLETFEVLVGARFASIRRVIKELWTSEEEEALDK